MINNVPHRTEIKDDILLMEELIEEKQIPDYNLMIFDQKVEDRATENIFMVVKGLEHNYPNEVNNPREIVAVDIVWLWFLTHQL